MAGRRSDAAAGRRGVKLLIAIPALNEEASIASIIERCLDAIPDIVTGTDVDAVEITVVSDGSTDRTVEIARAYRAINLIVFEKNRGYGAAIKEAWRQSDADLLAFLDADGTCDPVFFVPLCNAVTAEGVDVSTGCRRNPDSEMPALRKLGNMLFALLLSALSARAVRDTASGMRVVRREALPRLYPLPNGLHFTPAMSARVLLSSDLRLVELDMPYHEREGESKLHVGKDGVRFLRVILKTAVLFRPTRVFRLAALPFLLGAVAFLFLPVVDWIRDGTYPTGARQAQGAAGGMLFTAAGLLLCAGYLTGRIVEVVLDVPTPGRVQQIMRRVIGAPRFWVIPAILLVAGLAAGVLGEITVGEGRGLFTMVLLGMAAVLGGVIRLLDRFVNLVAERLRYELDRAPLVGGRR